MSGVDSARHSGLTTNAVRRPFCDRCGRLVDEFSWEIKNEHVVRRAHYLDAGEFFLTGRVTTMAVACHGERWIARKIERLGWPDEYVVDEGAPSEVRKLLSAPDGDDAA